MNTASIAGSTHQNGLSCACADAFRTACTRQEAELEAEQLLGSDFATSRRVQVLSYIHIMLPNVKRLTRLGLLF